VSVVRERAVFVPPMIPLGQIPSVVFGGLVVIFFV
jgi:hypothetical protein